MVMATFKEMYKPSDSMEEEINLSWVGVGGCFILFWVVCYGEKKFKKS